ncbi:protein of unknown function DUF347 [Chthoniobacter flavus Ellin428]|uniref:Membrane-anchored protein n=1 Tax=Chthoniobacter flavus Ellin428 TaxID=497964 RepID=B4DBB1_9BACT|nr:membrane protein [Chthoniobacter flavus]EDY16299.1 protein of unknown function DUF347 [Chthoniobacter flavus Ellin428]TCO84705.1 putative membrane-anchored protein [Chthoniobacter flavus]
MENTTKDTIKEIASKVPEVTFIFWIIKILATTLGETGGDAVTMAPLKLGYAYGTIIFAIIFIGAVVAQIIAKKYHPFFYWFTIIASTMLGTTMADFADRSLGIGYTGGSSILLVLVLLSLFTWRFVLGSVAIDSVSSAKTEAFYWLTIMFSQTLGTALGDWTASDDGLNLGFARSALLFGAMLAVIAALYAWTKISHTILFWAAFILTRPLGAAVGDFLDKPHEEGGLEVNRALASGILLVLIIILVLVFPHRAATRRQSAENGAP